MQKIIFVLAILIPVIANAGDPGGLAYSGDSDWDSATGVLTFQSSGSMPDSKEGFHWVVPSNVKRIVIGEGVTLRGAFRVLYRKPDNPLAITGKNRETSVIDGTDEERWTTKHQIPENDKWKYGALSVLADAEVHITDLTSKNPRGYNISGYAKNSILHVSRCNLLDTRKGDNNNSDGFVGAAGSTIADTLISTSDDGIKVYHDVTIKNVVIEHHRNGAPIQFGWGGETEHVKATIENLTIIGVDKDSLYNMAPFTWEGGTSGSRDVTIVGLKVNLTGKLYDESTKRWLPLGLFELKPQGCTLNIAIENTKADHLNLGIRHTKGTIKINGVAAP